MFADKLMAKHCVETGRRHPEWFKTIPEVNVDEMKKLFKFNRSEKESLAGLLDSYHS